MDTKSLTRDADGHLANKSEWNGKVAEELAKEEGIEKLTDRHWAVINFMRKEFTEKGDAPSIRKLTKESGVDTKELYKLFPKVRQKNQLRLPVYQNPKVVFNIKEK